MINQVKEAAAFLHEKGFFGAQTGIILGTGLGGLTEHIQIEKSIDYSEIPHFPLATVEFHKGKLILGTIGNKRVIVMSGRFHYYEGYSMHEVVFPVRVMHFLGIKQLIVSNASGNMNMNWQKGELMLITDHINLQPDNPLRGKAAIDFGQIFVDMSEPYDQKMNLQLRQSASALNINLHEGVYVAVSGPNLETKAEYRFLRGIGADVVGMSTVPEVIAANQLKLPVAAISVLTDDCDPDNLHPVDISDIIATAKTAEQDLIRLILAYIQNE